MKELDIERQNIAEYFVPKKIIYCDPATIVYWRDGSKTVVRVSNGDDFQKDQGFAMAVVKKIYPVKADFNRVVAKGKIQKRGRQEVSWYHKLFAKLGLKCIRMV